MNKILDVLDKIFMFIDDMIFYITFSAIFWLPILLLIMTLLYK